jgi:protein O-GlcNAc transferase
LSTTCDKGAAAGHPGALEQGGAEHQGGALLRAGQLAEAVELLEPFCRRGAGAQAWALLGLAYARLRRFDQGFEAVERALALQPNESTALSCKVGLLVQLGRFEQAAALGRRCVTGGMADLGLVMNLTTALLRLGRFPEALTAAEAGLHGYPGEPALWLNQGIALHQLARYAESVEAFDRALALRPNYVQALVNRASALLKLGRSEEGLVAAEAALARAPTNVQAQVNRAMALLTLGRYQDAITGAELALRTDSCSVEALRIRLNGLACLERFEEALAAADALLAGAPNDADALADRAAALLELARSEEALASVEKARGAHPAHLPATFNHAAALAALGRFEEADALFEVVRCADPKAFSALRAGAERGLEDERQPDHEQTLDAASYYCGLNLKWLKRCFWGHRQAFIERLPGLVEDWLARNQSPPISAFSTAYLPLSGELRLRVARASAQAFRRRLDTAPAVPAAPPPAARLRIGYLSADFRNHPTAHLMRSLFGCHDRAQVEVFGYALHGDDGSRYYRDIAAGCDTFVDLSAANAAEAAERIRTDGIHVLVDLMGYSRLSRPEIVLHRPAPVQVSYLGHPGTLGMEEVQYILVDPIILPPQQARFYTEAPVYLPDSYQVNDRWQVIAKTGTRRSDHGLPECGVVFCCFNSGRKIEPSVFEVWMSILRRVPGSVLWLLEYAGVASALRQEARARGIEGERLVFAGWEPKDLHLERVGLADLFLDTLTYNAHTTASDALWAGVPVLTRPGDALAARVAASLLSAAGLPELIVESLDEYERLAVELATCPEALAAVRAKLRKNRLHCPLFDTERFARHLERAYRMMWEIYESGAPPRPITVPEYGSH